MAVSRTQVVKFIRKGEKGDAGDGGISINISPENVVIKQGVATGRGGIPVYVDLYEGGTRINYNSDGSQTSDFSCGMLTDSVGGEIVEGLKWNFSIEDGRFYYNLRYDGTTEIDVDVPFTVNYKGATYNRSFRVQTIANGSNYTDNLLLKSASVVTNSEYNIARYDLAQTPVTGNTYTITIWGTLGTGKTLFYAYNSSPSVKLCDIKQVANGVYQGTFSWINSQGATTIDNPTTVYIYAAPFETTANSTINKIKLEEGANANPVWTPAAAEMVGERGPAIRGPRDWNDTSNSYTFYSGAAGEPFIDLVVYGGYYYLCKQTHNWSASYRPGTSNGSAYWQLFADYEAIATKILLAKYALVENLGVTAIEMTNSSGDMLFTAKNGDVTCNTGNFKNVNISGTSVFTGLVKKAKTVVTKANFNNIFSKQNDSDNQYYINLEEAGTWIDIQYIPSGGMLIYPKGVREIAGNTILFYNRTNENLSISGNGTNSNDIPISGFASTLVGPGNFIAIDWKIGAYNGKELVYYVYQRGTIDTTLD